MFWLFVYANLNRCSKTNKRQTRARKKVPTMFAHALAFSAISKLHRTTANFKIFNDKTQFSQKSNSTVAHWTPNWELRTAKSH